MGKRSNFKRRKQDKYMTPPAGVVALIPHLPDGEFTFVEPCAHDGRLISHLNAHRPDAFCTFAGDINPAADDVQKLDILSGAGLDFLRVLQADGDADFIITNPPWSRALLHPMITEFSRIAPTWLLFDSAWMMTQQARRLMPLCAKVLTVGRLRWIENTDDDPKDDAAWHLFDARHTGPTLFYPHPGQYKTGKTHDG